MEPVTGALLIAAPTMGDPNFARSIVLLLDTSESGALGVVLNRPTELEVADVLEPWADLVAGPRVLFQGGPVETDSALGVATVADEDDPVGWRRVFGSTGLVDLDAPVEIMASAVSSLRIFAGYAGWGAGQLEAEIEEGAWYVVPAEPQDPFLADPERLWAQVLRRQGGQLAMLATMPAEPGLN
ncbi:MAG TPA: YqgE/AlgH family protein [Marmoricola sp.]